MKRWLIGAAISAVLVGVGFALRTYQLRKLQTERAARYATELGAYSSEFRLGTTRQDIELRLQTRNVAFSHICCIGSDDHGVMSDLIKIGEEPDEVPWYCSRKYVYIGLQFSSTQHSDPPVKLPSDTLRRVTVWQKLEGCL